MDNTIKRSALLPLALLLAFIITSYDLLSSLLADEYTRPVTVSVEGIPEDRIGDLTVERLRLQPERAELERDEDAARWFTQTGLTRDVILTLPEALLPELEHITVNIGSGVYSYSPTEIKQRWSVEHEEDHVVLRAPEKARIGIPLPLPMIGEIRNVATWYLAVRLVVFAAAAVVMVWSASRLRPSKHSLWFAAAVALGALVLVFSRLMNVPVIVRTLSLLLALSWISAFVRGRDDAPDIEPPSLDGRASFALPLVFRSIGVRTILWVLVIALLVSHAVNLGVQHMWRDEFFSFAAAEAILERGAMIFPSGFDYGRAPVYHSIIAGSMSLFGVDELGSRIPNVLFNILAAACLYIFLKRRGRAFAVTVIVVWLSLNVTLAVTRTTRMYGMLTFTYLLVATSFYFMIVSPPENRFTFPLVPGLRVNVVWLVVFLASFWLSWDTQRLTALFIFGAALWFLLAVIFLDQKPVYGGLLLLSIAAIVFGAWYRSGSFDLIKVYFIDAAPGDFHISDLDPLHYLSHMNGSVVLFPMALIGSVVVAALRRNMLILYVWGVFAGSFSVLSLQHFLANRYVSFLFPFMAVLLVYTVWHLVGELRHWKLPRGAITVLLVAVFSLHAGLYAVELTELESYTEDSIRKKKKRQFNDVAEYIASNQSRFEYLVADNGAAYVLASKHIDPDFIVLEPRRAEGRFAHQKRHGYRGDRYTGIPYMVMPSEDFCSLLRSEDVLLVIDNEESLEVIPDSADYVDDFSDPHVLFSPQGSTQPAP